MVNQTNERSIAALLGDLTREMSDLTRQEVELAKAEISDKVDQVTIGVSSLAAGAIVAFVGVLGVVAGFTVWLGDVTGWSQYWPWLAPLVVGVVVAGIGVIMLVAGRNKLKAQRLAPSLTMESVRKDRDTMRGHMA